MANAVRKYGQAPPDKIVNSVDRAIRILDYCADNREVTLTQLAQEMQAPKTTVFDILRTLESRAMVQRDPATGGYSPGLHMIELGYSAVRGYGVRRVLAPVLQALNEELDETVHLTVLDDAEVLYIECYESSKRLRTYSVIGIRGPLHCTSVGKAILAWLPPGKQDDLLGRIDYEGFTENTITDAAALRRELLTIHQRGYAVDDVEHEEGVRCVGVPVFGRQGEVAASVSVSGPTQRITLERVPHLALRMIAAAAEMSRRLGFNGGVERASVEARNFSKE